MSWSFNVIGRAGTLSKRLKEDFEKTGGCHPGAEADAKNKAGEIVASLAASMSDPNTVLKVSGQGSAWKEGDSYKSQSFRLEFETIYQFVE